MTTQTAKTIFRRAKDRDNPFVMIDKTIFEDSSVSWKAKGLMGYLLSRPDDWTVRMGDLIKRSTDGITSVRTAILELERHGYITRFRERDESGRFLRYVCEVHEVPVPPEQRTRPEKRTPPQEPQSGFPIVDAPTEEKPPLTNIDLTHTDLTNMGPASAGSPPPVTKPEEPAEEKEPEPEKATAQHSAVQAFRSGTHRYPPKSWYPIIAETIGDKEEDVARWTRIVMAWVGMGWNPCNVKGMLEYWGRVSLPGEERRNGGDRDPPRGHIEKEPICEPLPAI